MIPVLIGALALILILFLLRGFIALDIKVLLQGLRYAGVVALGAAAVFLFFIERPGAAVFVAGAAWSLFTRGHAWPGGWPHWGRGKPAAAGRTSQVRTAWLEMALDHDSGEMRGTVLKGAYAGKRLDELGRDAQMAFHAESAVDAETKRLLEAYFDRVYGPGWDAGPQAPGPEAPARAATGMTRAEALKVLGLGEGASSDDIRAAHRRLMLQNHPDRGGTDYLASKINEAKDLLLGE